MPASMTGVGLAAGPTEIGELRIEVRTVNGRSLAIKLRLSPVCAGFEAAIEQAVRARLSRGTAIIVVEHVAGATAGLDRDAVQRAAKELTEAATAAGLPGPTLADVLAWAAPTGGHKEPSTSRPLPPQVEALLKSALDELQRCRAAEGDGTATAMRAELAEFENGLHAAEQRSPQLVAHYRDRLLARVQEFVQQHVEGGVPAVDLVREVAIHADRVDVAEEFQRLRAHLAEFRAILDGGDGGSGAAGGGSGGAAAKPGAPVGRRLEFLLQELLRETNTLGSKSPDTELSHTVVGMKSSIDRLKEQVANLE